MQPLKSVYWKMDDSLVIQINGLPDGITRFHWDLGKEFFASFGNSDILDAGVGVDAKLEKSGDYIGFDVELDGTLTVPCDRCLAPLEMEIRSTFNLSVGTGEIPEDAEEYDLGQDVYDYACLAIPLRRVHQDGDCDPEVAGRLGEDKAPVSGDSPFASLEALLGDMK